MFGSVGEIIDALGGTGSVAEAQQLNPSTVSSWRARGSIPADRWLDIVGLAEARGVSGITLAALAALRSRSLAEQVEARA